VSASRPDLTATETIAAPVTVWDGPFRSMQPTAPTRRRAPSNRVQRVSGRCVACGTAVVAHARGPIARRCVRCTDLRRRGQQLRAYVASAMRTARVLQRSDVATALSMILQRMDEAPRPGSRLMSIALEAVGGLPECPGSDRRPVDTNPLRVVTLETHSFQVNNPPAARIDPKTRTARTRNPSRSQEVAGARRRSTREA
jgi:hypothetical protein